MNQITIEKAEEFSQIVKGYKPEWVHDWLKKEVEDRGIVWKDMAIDRIRLSLHVFDVRAVKLSPWQNLRQLLWPTKDTSDFRFEVSLAETNDQWDKILWRELGSCWTSPMPIVPYETLITNVPPRAEVLFHLFHDCGTKHLLRFQVVVTIYYR